MPPKTKLKNKWEEYWISNPKEWHRNEIGIYHVSAVGCNNQHLKPDDHSGPCLRDTFYKYINPIDDAITSKGNLNMGTVIHEAVQEIYHINKPYTIIEFPLSMDLDDGIFITGSIDGVFITGSIDVVEFNKDGTIDVIDFKSSSNWTFPYSEESKNPTHFNQVYIYAYWLSLLMNKDIRVLKVVYINKHDQYTGEQIEKYDEDKGMSKFIDYISRVKKLDSCLMTFKDIEENHQGDYKNEKELVKAYNNCLPDPEPHHWCKYCNYRFRCRDNIIFDEDLQEVTLEDIEKQYKKETGKNPRWRGNYTKQFKKYKEGYKIIKE